LTNVALFHGDIMNYNRRLSVHGGGLSVSHALLGLAFF